MYSTIMSRNQDINHWEALKGKLTLFSSKKWTNCAKNIYMKCYRHL